MRWSWQRVTWTESVVWRYQNLQPNFSLSGWDTGREPDSTGRKTVHWDCFTTARHPKTETHDFLSLFNFIAQCIVRYWRYHSCQHFLIRPCWIFRVARQFRLARQHRGAPPPLPPPKNKKNPEELWRYAPTKNLPYWHWTFNNWHLTFEHLNIWTFEHLNIWIFEHLSIWTFENLKIWTFEHLIIWTYIYFNIGRFEHWNIWILEYLKIWTF